MLRSGRLGATVIALGTLSLAAQEPQQPVFRTGVETVAIYATVLDRYGELVLDLKADDFKVFDNGRIQKLTTFQGGLQPITAILLLDTSASMALSLDLAREAAEQFVIRLMPGDKARVGTFSDRIDIHPEFTSDRDELLRALRDVHIGNPTLLWDAVDEGMTQLAALGGRRVLMLFTDGVDTASRRYARQVFDRARADELMVYAVQFRTSLRGQQAEFSIALTPSQVMSSGSRNPPATAALQEIAGRTGGGHFYLTRNDNVNATFTRVAQELHHQYVLGFTPETRDGKIHDLVVRIDRPHLTVRARQSYLAPGKAR